MTTRKIGGSGWNKPKYRLATLAWLAAVLAAPVAAQTTYSGSHSFSVYDRIFHDSTVTATLSITTDGTLGALTQSNILDWTVLLSGFNDPINNFAYSPANSRIALLGDALLANASTLTFDFGSVGPDFLEFYQYPDPGDGLYHYYCLQTDGSCVGTGPDTDLEAVWVRANITEYSVAPRTGNFVLGTAPLAAASGVPEPAAWALMILGFGLVGARLRTRRRPARAALG